MFLKAIKRKSIKRKLDRALQHTVETDAMSKITSIGFLVDARHFTQTEKLWDMAREVKGNDRYCKVLCYVESVPEFMHMRAIKFDEDTLSWNGHIKYGEMRDFIDREFDLLVNLYNEDTLSLNYVAAISKARFKAGLPIEGHTINDLTIDVPLNALEDFGSELKKYLKILNKI